MKNTDIEKQLEEFFAPFLDEKNENRVVSRSMLIDGPWGCGKTYQIMKFLKKHEKELRKKNKKRIGYISLFGLNSIEEINTEICNSLFSHSKKMMNALKKSMKVFGTVLRASSYFCGGLGSGAEIAECLSSMLGPNQGKAKKKAIIIIDDLERLSTDKVSYSDLLGYLNGLMAGNCRIICVMNSRSVINSRNSEENGFKDFYEKVFDEIRIIDDVTDDTYAAIFQNNDNNKDYDISPAWYPLFKSNLRIAQRTYLNYKKVLKHIEDKNKYVSYEEKMTKEDLFKLCYYSTYMTFKYLFDEKKAENGKDGVQQSLPGNVPDDWISYALEKLYEEKVFADRKAMPDFYFRVRIFVSFLFENNSSGIDSIFEKVVPLEISILNREFFYLSEENKKKYYDEFLERIHDGNYVWGEEFWNKLVNILDNSQYSFTDREIDDICNKIIRENGSVGFINSYARIKNDSKYSDSYKEFMGRFQKRYLESFDDGKLKQFKSFIENQQYEKASELLDKIDRFRDSNKKMFIDDIIENKFYLIDLSGEISQEGWHFCTTIVKFIYKYNGVQTFTDFVDDMISSNPKNYNLKSRLLDLKKVEPE